MTIEVTGAHTTARVLVGDESLAEAGVWPRFGNGSTIRCPVTRCEVNQIPLGSGHADRFHDAVGDRIVPNAVGVDVVHNLQAPE